MNPGELDRRVIIQQATETRQVNGETTYAWATYGTRWAKYEPVSVSEIVDDGRIVIFSKSRFTIRWDGNLNEKYRVSYQNKIYNIESVEEVGRRAFMVLECESRDITDNTDMAQAHVNRLGTYEVEVDLTAGDVAVVHNLSTMVYYVWVEDGGETITPNITRTDTDNLVIHWTGADIDDAAVHLVIDV